MKTVPLDILINFAIGLFVPLAARKGIRAERSMVINRYFLALLLFELLLFVPLGGYLYFFHPDWSLMYFVNTSALEPKTVKLIGMAALAMYVFSIIAGFLLSARLVNAGRAAAAGVLLAAVGTGIIIFSLLTLRRLLEVGPYAAWSASPMTTTPLYLHPIGYVVGVYAVVMTAVLVMMTRHFQEIPSSNR